MNASPPFLLRMSGITKSFPGVHALKNVNLELRAGEVLGLVGENGAGKSTLIKVLGGAHRPDRGTIDIQGVPVEIGTPVDGRKAGVGVIYQEFNLVPGLTARENIFLGRERTRWGCFSWRREHEAAVALFQRIGVVIDPEARCGQLSVAQQQVVEIAKALSLDARILVMDEPSATLTPQEVERLFRVIRDLKAQGMGIIYISHRLEEIFSICDRVKVMRDGECIADEPVAAVCRERLIELMVGRSFDQEFPPRESHPGADRLVVRGLRRGQTVRDVSFSIRSGEILALAGLVGAGRTETARLIFGADRSDAGAIELDGRSLHIRHPRDAIANEIGLLTEDRKGQGLILRQSLRENFGLPNLASFSRGPFVVERRERTACARFVSSLAIKTPHQDQPVLNLSGGNQQKVVLAKWLQRDCEVVIFDEPTRGIDVGAKYEIYLLMNELAAQGKAILMISSELSEILGMADRILVMHEGRITGEIPDARHATQEMVMELAVQ